MIQKSINLTEKTLKSDIQFGFFTKECLVFFQNRLDHILHKLLNLFHRTTGKVNGVQHCLNLGALQIEIRIVTKTADQIIGKTVLVHSNHCVPAMKADNAVSTDPREKAEQTAFSGKEAGTKLLLIFNFLTSRRRTRHNLSASPESSLHWPV